MDDNVKLTLVEQALQSNYSRKKLDRVSLRQLVNRLLLLTQKPRIFIFYKKAKKGGGWIYSFSTHGDVLYQSDFQKQIKDELHIKKEMDFFYQKPPLSEWPDEPQEIGNTGFGIILVAIEAKTINAQRRVSFKSASKYNKNNKELLNSEYDILSKLWDSFLGCEFSQTLGVEARLKKRLEQIGNNPKAEKSSIKTSVEGVRLNSSDKKFIHMQLGYLSKIINDCYNDVCETPLVCNQGKIPPNIFFFVRYYDSPETINRFRDGLKNGNAAYPYSLKIIIPETQREHLLDTLKGIADSNINFAHETCVNTWNYKYKLLPGYEEIYPTNSLQSDSCYPRPELDFKFWHKIKTGKFDEILDDIQQPFTQEARSFVDPALMTGFIHYRSGVYEESGLERITEKAKKLGFQSPDIRRLIYLHYLFSAAAPDSNHENLGTMTVPLNVANHPYVAIVQAIVTKNEGEPDFTDRISWPQNYHFFSDVARHCVRKLRYHSKVQYIQQIEKIVYKAFKRSLKVGDNNEVFMNLAETQRIINKNLLLLCRVWPYSNVSIKIRRNITKRKSNYVPILHAVDSSTGLFFTIEDNPFFTDGKENQDLNLLEKDGTVFLSKELVRQAFVRTLLYLEELISISILKKVKKH